MKLFNSKYFIIALIFGLMTTAGVRTARAQQESLFSQYMFNRLVINPAYAGTKGHASFTTLYRHQWSDFEGAPRTFTLSGHGALNNRMSQDKSRIRHGIGGYGVFDSHGAFDNVAVGGNYAFGIPLRQLDGWLSFGLQFSIISWQLNGSEIDTRDPNDPVFPETDEAATVPDLGAGVFFNTRKLYIGGSIAHLTESKLELTDVNEEAKLERHYFLTAGYDISLKKNDNLILTPSFFFRSDESSDSPYQLEFNANVMMIQRFWAGMGYRTDDAVIFMAGFYPFKQLRVGYAYDLNVNPDFNDYNDGSHEIMLSIDFGDPNKTKVVTPRYF